MRDDLHGHGHADVGHARQAAQRANHELADRLELALARIAQFHFHRDIAAVHPHVAGGARGYQVAARVGIDHGAQGIGYLFNGEAQGRLRFFIYGSVGIRRVMYQSMKEQPGAR
ncbi:hypothetical protein D3C86_1623850 [compost metagenome]